jgi:hypothetical protein
MISDTDYGYKALVAALGDKPFEKSVKVGVPDTVRADGQINDEVAARNEFGFGVPERSFLRSYVDQNAYHIADRIVAFVVDVALNNRFTWLKAFQNLGAEMVQNVQDHIETNIPPPLSPRTVQKKGHDLALVETHELIESITFETDAGRSP